jgi:hypothetical protein
MNNAAPQFTAAQIARALGKKRQAIQRELRGIVASGVELVNGNEASAWHFSALPSRLQTELNNEARRRGCADAIALLTMPPQIWQPPIPVQQVRAEFVSRALKLRDALAQPLVRQHTLSPGQLTELGTQEFSRVFGYGISAKQWNRLFDRAVLRDNGAEQFHRVEIYLDDAAFQKPIAKVVTLAKQYDHSVLNEVIAHVENKEKPTAADEEWIYTSAFRHFESVCVATQPGEHIAVKASLVAFLFSSLPGLAKNVTALHRNLNRKFQKLRAGLEIADQRPRNSGRFRRPDFTEDEEKIRNESLRLHKNTSLAHRRLRQRGELSKEYVEYHPFDIRVNKSAVPASTRKAITPQIDAMLDQYKGEREVRLRGPAIPRDWSDTLPGDYLSGDDTSLNHPFSTPNERGGVDILTGEFLVLNDLRTGFPLDHQLITGHYNGRHIVSGLRRVHDSVGLARKGGYWEKGVWESRWMPGVNKKHSVHFRETELRLQKAGFDLGCLRDFEQRHAISPRSKPIERFFGQIQSMMMDRPGYMGRNQRLDKLKPMQDFVARCRRGTEDPRNEGIMPMEHWLKEVGSIIEEYANEPQNGKMLPGVAPREMWEDGLSKRPMLKLPPELLIGLTTNRRVFQRIPATGIVLREVPQFVYCNEELGRWRLMGRPVVTFYNIDVPELLTVANLELTEFFTIKGIGLKAMTATPDELRAANAQIRGFTKPARVLFGQIRQAKKYTITTDAPDTTSKALGQFHNAETAAHSQKKTERTRKLNKVRTTAAALGAPVPQNVRNPDRVLQGQELERQAREQLAKEEAE